MRKIGKYTIYTINIIYVLMLVFSILPLLMLANFNYPSADDWSFGVKMYHILQDGGSAWNLICGLMETVLTQYQQWEGRFTIVFLSAIHPGIWGEQYYAITTWIMLAAIICSQVVLASYLLGKDNAKNVLPIVVPIIILQILFVPYPEESLFWYNGSVNYTFLFAITLVFVTYLLRWLFNAKDNKVKYRYLVVLSLVAFFIGGGNFATSVSSILFIAILMVYLLMSKEVRRLIKVLPIFFFDTLGLMIALLSPGRTIRIDSNFGGSVGNPIEAIFMSLFRTATNIYSWTDLKVLFSLCLIVPFLWMSVKNTRWNFKLPWVYTIFSFGVYSSMIVATMYVDGTTGGGRMGAILYYAYYVWMVTNVGYWIGWLQRRSIRCRDVIDKMYPRYTLLTCAIFGVLLLAICGVNKECTTFYKAYRSLRQGWAQEYGQMWEERLVLLHDPTVAVVQVELLDVYPEMVVYADLQDEDGYLWVNSACATYYEKKLVEVIR